MCKARLYSRTRCDVFGVYVVATVRAEEYSLRI